MKNPSNFYGARPYASANTKTNSVRTENTFFLRIHVWFTIIALFVYSSLGFLWGPTFRAVDMYEKWSVFADDEITVSANALPSPAVPIVSGVSECLSDEIQIRLDCADDMSFDSFDVYRDGSLLASGLLFSHYDESAFADTNHSYVVKAYGQKIP